MTTPSTTSTAGDRRLSTCQLLAALGAALFALGACQAPPQPHYPPISYRDLPPIRLDVAEIEFLRDYSSPGAPPNVEHLFPDRPADAAERWGRDRLEAVGEAGVARLVVNRASVVEVPLERTGGVRGLFTREPAERYDGVIEVTVEIRDRAGASRGHVSARAEHRRSVQEGISLNAREKAWHELTQAMMDDINASLERQLRTRLAQFVRN